MTPRANARLAGSMFLYYIAIGVASMVLFNQATRGAEGTAAVLASIAQHETLVRLTAALTLLTFFIAVALAVTLYALTRDQDRDLAMIALCCRVGEGVIAAVAAVGTLQLLSVAEASTAAAAPDAAAVNAFGALLLKQGGSSTSISATCFAVGSTIFAYLLLRGRIVPVALAWLGVVASVLAVVVLILQAVDVLGSPITDFMWLPMLAFEVLLALWLIVKGAALPARRPSVSPGA